MSTAPGPREGCFFCCRELPAWFVGRVQLPAGTTVNRCADCSPCTPETDLLKARLKGESK